MWAIPLAIGHCRRQCGRQHRACSGRDKSGYLLKRIFPVNLQIDIVDIFHNLRILAKFLFKHYLDIHKNCGTNPLSLQAYRLSEALPGKIRFPESVLQREVQPSCLSLSCAFLTLFSGSLVSTNRIGTFRMKAMAEPHRNGNTSRMIQPINTSTLSNCMASASTMTVYRINSIIFFIVSRLYPFCFLSKYLFKYISDFFFRCLKCSLNH